MDHRRRAELLDAAVDHASREVFAELSFRSVAAALGVSTTTLVHHFGTKDRLLGSILERLRERLVASSEEIAGEHPDLATAARAFWDWSSDEAQWPSLRLFFAVYGHAVQSPGTYGGFLDTVGADWIAVLVAAQGPSVEPADATARATVVVATIRGLLLDVLATGDRARVEEAAAAFLSDLAPRST
ncbi:TetR/AcrR family transcriptional regulator [Actinomycetospora termitidis]|uniref:TetR/AcrR family transcriptional regulator n=1 Tax=Actinomycetospora termitidis TaxID=3053470 RepID=A0ABT7MLJ1_9PSEU|nr:TetR/AcrR family transcriptional regulator [Actinomycetospora sp. Odt1-22]MDL5160303.1 TetR/AcrR family transcriptional regulator [Actinomycetospora sp. Odt1-22]